MAAVTAERSDGTTGEKQDQPTYEILQESARRKSRVVLANHKIFGRRCVQKIRAMIQDMPLSRLAEGTSLSKG